MAGFDNDVIYGSGIDLSGGATVANKLNTDGYLYIGNSSGNPVAAALTSTGSTLTVTNGAGSINIDVTAPLTVANGGTGATTLTDHGILLGSGTGAITATAVPTNGQLLIGSTGADPVPASVTAGTGIAVTGGAGTLQLDAVGGGITWTVVTGATQAAAVNNGYITNRGGGVTVTLPDTAAVGSVVRICGMAGLWVLAQNVGETVYFGSTNTTTGVGGTLTATNAGDCIELVCIVANTDWRVLSSIGNITVV